MAFEFREYRMQFERVPPGTRAVDRRALGRRSKLGGKPTWEHGGQTPACARCSEPMSFLAQIDSIEHEDPLASIDEGLGKAVTFLQDVLLQEAPSTMWWA